MLRLHIEDVELYTINHSTLPNHNNNDDHDLASMETPTPFIIFNWLSVKMFVIVIDLFELLTIYLLKHPFFHSPHSLRFPCWLLWIQIVPMCSLFSRKFYENVRAYHSRLGAARLRFRKKNYFVIFYIYLQNPGKKPVKERCATVAYIAAFAQILCFYFYFSISVQWFL